MKNPSLTIGLAGTFLAALCCFTPLLPLILGAVGAGTLLSVIYTDAVLLPVLGLFLLMTGVGLWRRKSRS